MLAVEIAVGVYYLVATTIPYHCNGPSKSLRNSKIHEVSGNIPQPTS
ncbi:TomO hydrophobic C-terminal domain-containing protein [Wolbachia endosymbiont of Brugia pahangi]